MKRLALLALFIAATAACGQTRLAIQTTNLVVVSPHAAGFTLPGTFVSGVISTKTATVSRLKFTDGSSITTAPPSLADVSSLVSNQASLSVFNSNETVLVHNVTALQFWEGFTLWEQAPGNIRIMFTGTNGGGVVIGTTTTVQSATTDWLAATMDQTTATVAMTARSTAALARAESATLIPDKWFANAPSTNTFDDVQIAYVDDGTPGDHRIEIRHESGLGVVKHVLERGGSFWFTEGVTTNIFLFANAANGVLNHTSLTVPGTLAADALVASSFAGNGQNLTNIPATHITGLTPGMTVSATGGLRSSGTTNVVVTLDTSTQLGAGPVRLLLMDTSLGTTNFYWSSAFISPTGGINVQYFTNSSSFGALSSTTTADQAWIVPGTVSQIVVKAWGAGGGGGNTVAGASGGYAFNVIAVTPGETLTVRVGQGGRYASATPSLPGGGLGAKSNVVNYAAGNGGGYSGVFRGTNILIIAGGGGGGAAGSSGNTGGAGGGSTGGAGAYGSNTNLPLGAQGGSQTNGGAAGGTFPIANIGTSGSFLQGGVGSTNSGIAGGGGGGGYYGGGGGGSASGTSGTQGGGGGGSCYAPAPFGLAIRGYNSGDEDWQASWGAGGSSTVNGADGRVIIKYQ